MVRRWLPANKFAVTNGDCAVVLVVGADGAIGSRLIHRLASSHQRVVGTTRRAITKFGQIYLDLAGEIDYSSLPSCQAVVLCAGVTSIARCRLEPNLAKLINVDNTVRLARFFLEAGSHVVFLSSNSVFDGKHANSPAGAQPSPITEYGYQKAAAESQMMAVKGALTIVRFGKVITPTMPLFHEWIRDLRANKFIYPFSDYRIAPISASFAIEVLLRVLSARSLGVVQASATVDISYAEAAFYLARSMGFGEYLIKPALSSEAGIRYTPDNTTLEPAKLFELGLQPPQPERAFDELLLNL